MEFSTRLGRCRRCRRCVCAVLLEVWRSKRRIRARATLSRLGIVFRGALATIRAAVSADVRLKPALVRIKTRLADPSQLAAMAGTVTAAPGSAAVEVDSDGMLVHVINEDAVDADDLGRIEARVGARGSAS